MFHSREGKQTDRSFKIKLSYELRKHLDRALRNDLISGGGH